MECTAASFGSQVFKDLEKMLMAFKRNPLGERVQPAPPAELQAPQLQLPAAPQGNPYGNYPQPPYMQHPQGDPLILVG